jgi:phosphatidylserine/phosphatidylglycerophosphate/cardiolipin synthase-like enzyme
MNTWLIVAGWLAVVSLYQSFKPVQEGMNHSGPVYHVSAEDVEFLADITYVDSAGVQHYDHEIYDATVSIIDSARRYILIDMFLLNRYRGPIGWNYKDITEEFVQLLIDKKQNYPDIKIDLITDPVNILYGGNKSRFIEDMQAAGINVIITDLTKLRDNSWLYSPFWRTFIQWLGNSDEYGAFPNYFDKDEPPTTARSYFALLNMKANHRKIIVADQDDKAVSIVTTWNAHSASSSFSNAAFVVRGDIWEDLYQIENHVAEFSGGDLTESFGDLHLDTLNYVSNGIDVQILSEKEIRNELLRKFDQSSTGDTISIAMFYLSSNKIIKSLIRAAKRGAEVRLILDPNKDGFGYKRRGIPNVPVAHRLVKKSGERIKVRWYLTHGEQFHTKFSMIKNKTGEVTINLGSANLTRKQLGAFNLELNINVVMSDTSALYQEIADYYDLLWTNRDGHTYTADYEIFESGSIFKKISYRIKEFTGSAVF